MGFLLERIVKAKQKGKHLTGCIWLNKGFELPEELIGKKVKIYYQTKKKEEK